MADPKLKRASVVIKYGANDGYSSTAQFSSSTKATPEQAIVAAIDELSRIASLFGLHQEAKAAFDDAQKRVAKWMLERNKAPTV